MFGQRQVLSSIRGENLLKPRDVVQSGYLARRIRPDNNRQAHVSNGQFININIHVNRRPRVRGVPVLRCDSEWQSIERLKPKNSNLRWIDQNLGRVERHPDFRTHWQTLRELRRNLAIVRIFNRTQAFQFSPYRWEKRVVG